jgi:hypothetical protein
MARWAALGVAIVLASCTKKENETIPDAPIAGTVGGATFALDRVQVSHVPSEKKWVVRFLGKGANVLNHPEVALWLKVGTTPAAAKTFEDVASEFGFGPIRVQLVGEKGPSEKNAEHGHYRLEFTKWDVQPPDPKTPPSPDLGANMRHVGKASGKVFVTTDDPGASSRLAGVFSDADVVDELPSP